MSDIGIFIFGFAVLGVTLAATIVLTIGTSASDEGTKQNRQHRNGVKPDTLVRDPKPSEVTLPDREHVRVEPTRDVQHQPWPRIAHS